MADLLETIWTEVINIDAQGKWMERAGKVPAHLKSIYAECAPALKRLQKLGSAQDLGQLSRFVRHQAVFELLYSIDAMGVPKGTSLAPAPLIDAAFSGKKPAKRMAEFIESLQETLSPDDDGEWILDLMEQDHEAMKDAADAVRRLTQAGATTSDLAQLAIWSSYDATVSTLRLMDEADLSIPDDVSGLYELLLGADPSGKEGGIGSWPWPPAGGKEKTSGKTKKGKVGAASSDEPLWRIRSGQTLAFSADNTKLAIGSGSGPARIFDALTGKELVTCEGIKAHIFRLAFSPDGKRLAVADQEKRLDICDASTGKLISKFTFSGENEISGLLYSKTTGELLRSSWSKEIDVIDPSGKKQKPILVDKAANMVDGIAFSPDEKKLYVGWSILGGESKISVWSWPERKELKRFDVVCSSLSEIEVSPDGKLIANSTSPIFGSKKPAILLHDANSGKEVARMPFESPDNLAFRPDGTLVIADEDTVRFLEPKAWKQIREIKDAKVSYDFALSPDGTLLAIAGTGGVRVWGI